MVTPQQIGVGLRDQMGEILVRKGRLAQHELAQAVLEARAAGQRLGEYLVTSERVDEEDVARALAEQYGLDFSKVDERNLGPEARHLIPEAVSKRLSALPLSATQESILVAVADPTDVYASDELQMIVGRRIDLVVGERSAIEKGLLKIYSANTYWAEPEQAVVTPVELRTDSIDAEYAESVPAIDAVNALLRQAIELRASDVHWVPRKSDLLVRVRVDGVMRDLDVVPHEYRAAVIARLKVMAQLNIAERRLPQHGRVSITLKGVAMDLRMAVLPSIHGEEIVLRIAYIGAGSLASIEQLGMDPHTHDVIQHALRRPSGALVVAGPTGSGKTTTLYAAIAKLNDGTRTIISIEDPVESETDGVVQIEINTRIGLTFASGLRTILRADPDVILVGEIRDAETAEIALQAAMTGHLVLTTIHANSAAAGLVRLRELGVAPTTIASAISCISSQRLVRTPCKKCGSGTKIAKGAKRRGNQNDLVAVESGCAACGHTGYDGRAGVYEALSVTNNIREVIDASAAEIEQAAIDDGMKTIYENACDLATGAVTTWNEVERVCGLHD